MICLLLSNFCFAEGRTLYDKGGIRFEYTEYIHKSFYCTENGLMYNLVDVQYTISNNSGKLAYVEYLMDVSGLANYAAGCAFKSNINLEHSSNNLGTGDQTEKISSGDVITGVIGGWIQQGSSPSWNFYTRFYNDPSLKPSATSINGTTVAKKNTSNKNDYSVRVDQDDLSVNPEDPNKKANELKRIKEQQDLAKQALIQQKQLQAQQAQKQKEIADEKKRRQDEYIKQQEIRAEKLRNEQNLIKENYTKNTNRIASGQKKINSDLHEIGSSYLENQNKERQEQENNTIKYQRDLQSEKVNSGGYSLVTCTQCGGDGFITCSECGGRGRDQCIYCSGKGKVTCGYCQGNGIWNNATCIFCGGVGTTNCSTCIGRGFSDCFRCNGQGKSLCTRCNGTGSITKKSNNSDLSNYNSNRSISPSSSTLGTNATIAEAIIYLNNKLNCCLMTTDASQFGYELYIKYLSFASTLSRV